jgi:hypothetical protein
MSSPWLCKALLVFVLAGAGLAVGCLRPKGSSLDGKYRVSGSEIITLELKDGKASYNFGPEHFDGTYNVDGDKIVIRPTVSNDPKFFGRTGDTMVLLINKDGSLGTPEGGPQGPGTKPVRYLRLDTRRWWETWK